MLTRPRKLSLANFRASVRPILALLIGLAPLHQAHAGPQDLLADYVAAAGRPADPARGRTFFTEKHGREWSCASCHTQQPGGPGQHAATGKVLAPMAPAFNPDRFSALAKTEKWFRRNCTEVVGRECSAGEKADVLAWLLSQKS